MDSIYFNENISDIRECIDGLFNKNQALMILEKIDEFLFINYGEEQDLAKWEKGRIFDADGEFRWRKFRNRIHGVYLGSGSPKNMHRDEETELGEILEDKIYLWGEIVKQKDMEYFRNYQGKNIYIELRIPFIFEYPLEHHEQRVLLEVKQYLDPSGDIQFLRYVGIAPRRVKEAS